MQNQQCLCWPLNISSNHAAMLITFCCFLSSKPQTVQNRHDSFYVQYVCIVISNEVSCSNWSMFEKGLLLENVFWVTQYSMLITFNFFTWACIGNITVTSQIRITFEQGPFYISLCVMLQQNLHSCLSTLVNTSVLRYDIHLFSPVSFVIQSLV